ncbi:DUF6998 domain-containing protein [Leisingera sp. M523]|uniref:DUF6998 domain-containing protein n=1 Tax=Leisingera sp. M523 TaxID=2867013 RepID=UPI0021A90063|nr:hypothetical protein [Leisingera sp. M523]UWQ28096.1 hypothetical protein K3557_15130 [Leisingera sp. M523]
MGDIPKVRSQSEILSDVKSLAIEYYRNFNKPLGVTGEIAEVEAAQALALGLAEARSPGFDAVRTCNGRHQTIQIKGRWKADGKNWGRVSSINTNHDFDFAMLVLMHKGYELYGIWEAPKEKVREFLDRPGSKARNSRRSMSVSQFISIGTRVWPRE